MAIGYLRQAFSSGQFTTSIALAGILLLRSTPSFAAQDAAPEATPADGTGAISGGGELKQVAANPPPPPEQLDSEERVPQDGGKEAQVAPVVPPPQAAVPATDPSAWASKVKIGGYTIFWHRQPLGIEGKGKLELFFASLTADVAMGDFGARLDLRFRDSSLRPFVGPTWIEEAYGYWQHDWLKLKVGKVYSRMGLFSDHSFYGNVHVFDGIKISPDLGVSAEAALGAKASGARIWAQYFINDGQTNYSLPGRDTISTSGARRRNEVLLRVEPFFRSRDGSFEIRPAFSGEYLQADLPDRVHNVYRFAADVTANWGPATVWVEGMRQNGRSVLSFPIADTPATDTSPAIPGQSSKHNNYALAGAEVAVGPVVGRYSFSYVSYNDVKIREWLHIPAVALKISDNFLFLTELVFWNRKTPEGVATLDRSLNFSLHASF